MCAFPQTEALLGDSFSRLHQLAFEDAYTTYPPSILVRVAAWPGSKGGVLCAWEQPGAASGLHGEERASRLPIAAPASQPASQPHTLASVLLACLQAAAAVYLGRKQRGMVPFWPSVLRRLTGYHEQLHPEVGSEGGTLALPACVAAAWLCTALPRMCSPALHMAHGRFLPCSCPRRCASCSTPPSTAVP